MPYRVNSSLVDGFGRKRDLGCRHTNWDADIATKFWEVDSLKQDVWHTVFRTVHVGDEVKAFEHDALDPDDRIGRDVVTGFSRGTLVFIGTGAKYRATYHAGAC